MTFLNPFILWGLLAVSVPIILHFFNLQRPKKILFSNVAFVREVKQSVVKRLKLTQWLLLLLRILAITALVLAFANPVLLQESGKALVGNRSIAIVVDNSYSMRAGNERGSYFQQAMSLSKELINAYTRQDEFLLMSTSDLKLNYSFDQQSEALEESKSLAIKQNIRSHQELLAFSDNLFAKASNSVQELYFLSDFQESSVMTDSGATFLYDSNRIVKYIPLASRDQQNVYIADHSITSQIVEAGKPVQMEMSLVNNGNTEINDLSIRVLLEGKVAAIANTRIAAASTDKLSLSFTPSSSGWLSGYIQLDDYPITFDNERYFSLYVPDKEKVLMVEGTPAPNLRLLYEEVFQQFETQFISYRALASEDLSEYRSVILVGLPDLSSGLIDRLSTFLNEGGSLMMIPAPQADLNAYNAFLGRINAGTIDSLVQYPNGILATEVDLAHPIFDGIFTATEGNAQFDSPKVFKHYQFKANQQLVQNSIIGLPNRQSILQECKIGNGLLYFFTLFPQDAWTNFHLKTVFAPVMFRATQIMNQTQNIGTGQEIGNFRPKLLRTSLQENVKMLQIDDSESPEDTREIIVEQYKQLGATVLSFEKLALTEGNYRLEQGENLLEKISFNISDQESKLAFVSADELPARLLAQGLAEIQTLTATPEEIQAQIQLEKEGIPLWKYFLIAAALFLLLEITLIKLSSRGKASSN